jgi:predicted PhzF superfamily epimerase YddE/YHI9
MTGIWIGRVFGRADLGGNHVAVVTQSEPAPRQRSRMLDFRNVTFVTKRHDMSVYLRTFTPHEELALCVTASLATPVALGALPGESWQVEHSGGVFTVSASGTTDIPVCWITNPSEPAMRPPATLPKWVPPHLCAWRLGQTRSRLYVSVEDADDLVLPDPVELRALCTDNDCRGAVFFSDDGRTVRSREFSVADDAELIATGGAAQGIGWLLHRQGRVTDTEIVQGPGRPASRGHTLLRFSAHGPEVGGQVLPLVEGQLAKKGNRMDDEADHGR